MTTEIDIKDRLAELQEQRRIALDERAKIERQMVTASSHATMASLLGQWSRARESETLVDQAIADLVVAGGDDGGQEARRAEFKARFAAARDRYADIESRLAG